MTKEEALNKAINIVRYFEANFAKSKEAREDLENIIEALEQEPKTDILGKIRAEIEELKPNNPNFKGYFEQNVALNKVLEVIDKYKAESKE